MQEIQWSPSDRQLVQFGLCGAVLLPVLAGIWGLRGLTLVLFVSLASLLAIVGWRKPGWLRWPFVGLSVVTFPIGLVVSELVLLMVFWGVFVPIGILFRWMGRDGLAMRREPGRSSYWEEKQPPAGLGSYYRQF